MAQSQWRKGDLRSVHQRVTERIIEQLEQGVVPWHSPHIAKIGFPRNYQSEKAYRGINVMLLAMAGYTSPWFLTYKQAQGRGGQVRKGEKGYPIVKFGSYSKELDDGEEEKRHFLRLYTVFNACQIDGIEFPQADLPPFTASTKTYVAKAIVTQMPHPPAIHEGRSVRTCYDPVADAIDIPHRSYFESGERFYKSLFHEMVHSTGAAKRLARKSLMDNRGISMSDKTIYGKEELVAEIGAAFLCAHAGIVMDNHENSASYISSWLTVLKQGSNQRWIVEAAGQAQQAVDYILKVEL
ncbi:antirestriction protein ArdC [Haloferula luteola]|uniref:Antirestriction protein ArdC n=1 Tax=Haloferula luteola TaxID=595692 RepID=A0A840VA53_9BACT|nr:ArdC-like ssDNA-binding domain-containing protein [Haloferula luteola]MBB5350659.1 antirestriction protein ArdC [Haloferula luteola]